MFKKLLFSIFCPYPWRPSLSSFLRDSRSNRSAPHTIVYQRHEKEKRRHYEERVRQVEQASFVPAVMSASGGMGPASTALYKRIAHLLAEKRGEHYSHVMAFVRSRISFSLLKSCIMCIRGCRRLNFGLKFAPSCGAHAALAVAEARLPT